MADVEQKHSYGSENCSLKVMEFHRRHAVFGANRNDTLAKAVSTYQHGPAARPDAAGNECTRAGIKIVLMESYPLNLGVGRECESPSPIWFKRA